MKEQSKDASQETKTDKPTEKTQTTQQSSTSTKKTGKGGWFAVGGCCGCSGLLILWAIAMYFLFGPIIQGAISDISNTNFNYNADNVYNEQSSTYNSNYNVIDNYSDENTQDNYSIDSTNITFGVIENDKFLRPITVEQNKSYTFAAKIKNSTFTPDTSMVLIALNDKGDEISRSTKKTTSEKEQTVQVGIEAGSTSYYIDLQLFVDGEFQESQVIATDYQTKL